MPPIEPPLAENSDMEEPRRGNFSPACVARLLCENVRLREESGALRARAITDRKDARYYKAMHGKAVERLLEKDGQIEAAEVVKVGQRVQVTEVDLPRKRIALSLKTNPELGSKSDTRKRPHRGT